MDEETAHNSSPTPYVSPMVIQDDIPSMENSNNCNLQNNGIYSPDLELDWAQIIYALNYKRLIFIVNHRTWYDFHTTNANNVQKYMEYSSEELCQRFLQRVLPNINEYELTDDELHLLALLDMHPNFRKTESGFEMIEQIENLSFPLHEAAIKIFTKREGSLQGTRFDVESVDANDQIAITGFNDQHPFRPKFYFNEENAALLSVVLSSDEDLARCELLTIEEIHKRLKSAKNRFEMNGQQLENINILVDDLFKKLKSINDLKAVVNNLVDKSLRNLTK